MTVYTIDIFEGKKSRLTIDYYVSNGFLNSTLFSLFRKNKLKDSFTRSLENLDALATTLVIPA